MSTAGPTERCGDDERLPGREDEPRSELLRVGGAGDGGGFAAICGLTACSLQEDIDGGIGGATGMEPDPATAPAEVDGPLKEELECRIEALSGSVGRGGGGTLGCPPTAPAASAAGSTGGEPPDTAGSSGRSAISRSSCMRRTMLKL